MYACIDLKSFYASCECVERKLDPLNTNLVVADLSRTEKTVCLAITPSLKKYGLSGRSRLYEVIQKVREVNLERRKKINHKFTSKSYLDNELIINKNLELDYITAPPRMALYMKYSIKIYNIYLSYFSKEDLFSYSIDEVFIDISKYLTLYKLTPEELIRKVIRDVYNKTGITATGGVGTNMYLAKIAMDIVAKKMEPDQFGVRIAYLDEIKYRKTLWDHTPLTDFWRIGHGISEKLKSYRINTMGDLALASLTKEKLLYNIFGINAEILIDHAWGYEPSTIKSVKNVKPKTKSMSLGQVIHIPYPSDKARLLVQEMMELLSLDLVDKHYITDHLTLFIQYDVSNLTNNILETFVEETTTDFYGRTVPKPSGGTIRLDNKTNSTYILTNKILELYDKIVNKNLLIRKLNIAACSLDSEENKKEIVIKQLNLFNNEEEDQKNKFEKKYTENEIKIQKTIINIKNKYGKNAIFKGMNKLEGATTLERNKSIGGHSSGE